MQRKLPSPGFQVEVVLVDYSGTTSTEPNTESSAKKSEEGPNGASAVVDAGTVSDAPSQNKDPGSNNKDDVFSDSEAEEYVSSQRRQAQAASLGEETVNTSTAIAETNSKSDQVGSSTPVTEQFSLLSTDSQQMVANSQPKSGAAGGAVSDFAINNSESEFKAMAADASVFTFGDFEDYESE
uniref:Uncharacterized protein n=1 Tax=Rhizophora mucronata TaxID=61149 RepID=A0A2P2LP13_RHIMU